jgi:hypothetical protein
MRAAAYIGRVGGLAVALGVGAAIATGQGVAWADSTAGDAPGGSPTSQNSSAGDSGAPGGAATSSQATSESTGQGAKGTTGSAPSTRGSAPKSTVGNGRTPGIHSVSTADGAAATGGYGSSPEPSPVKIEKPKDSAPVADQRVTQSPIQNRSTNVTVVESKVDTASASKVDAAVAEPTQDQPAAEQKTETSTAVMTMAAVAPVTLTTSPATAATTANPVVVVADTTTPPPATATAPSFSLLSVVSSFLGALGLNTLSGPGPVDSTNPLSWIFAAFTRRDFGQTLNLTSFGTASPVATQPLAAEATATPATTFINWLTGPASPNATPARFSVAGTDLGIMWDNGATGTNRQLLIAFGDTFSEPGMAGDWRSNILFRSADRVLSDQNGLLVPNPQYGNIYAGSPVLQDRQNFSKQLVYGIPGTIGLLGIPQLFGSEVTMIPTAGISVPGAGVNGAPRQYMNVMSVRQWGPAGMWTTNYSAIAYSDDNGENWTLDPNTIRSAGFLRTWGYNYVPGNENFQQGAFVRPPAGSPDAEAGYIYSFGTPAGRFGPAYVSRVNENQILDLSAYEYWNGDTWVANDPGAAVPIFGATQQGPLDAVIALANDLLGLFGVPVIIPRGDVSEMSVQYNDYLDEYIVLYTDSSNSVVMRTAGAPEGAWSDPQALVTSAEYPGLYAPMINPWSGTGYLLDSAGNPENPKYLYWNMSQWDQYNVRLMRTDLSTLV